MNTETQIIEEAELKLANLNRACDDFRIGRDELANQLLDARIACRRAQEIDPTSQLEATKNAQRRFDYLLTQHRAVSSCIERWTQEFVPVAEDVLAIVSRPIGKLPRVGIMRPNTAKDLMMAPAVAGYPVFVGSSIPGDFAPRATGAVAAGDWYACMLPPTNQFGCRPLSKGETRELVLAFRRELVRSYDPGTVYILSHINPVEV